MRLLLKQCQLIGKLKAEWVAAAQQLSKLEVWAEYASKVLRARHAKRLIQAERQPGEAR